MRVIFTVFSKLVLLVLVVILSLLPLIFYVFAKDLLYPAGFWQSFILRGDGIWFVGMFQLFFGVAGVLVGSMILTS